MPRGYDTAECSNVSEMAIVDTFTKLIFGEEETYSARELMIIQALRAVDINVALDSHRDMGEYLRALGVRELITLVSQVRVQLQDSVHALPRNARAVVDAAGHLTLKRRAR